MLETPHYLVGSVEQICEDLLTYRERYGISYISAWEEYLETFTLIVERLYRPSGVPRWG